MKLLGKDLPKELWTRIEERLMVRGIGSPSERGVGEAPVEPRVDPLSFNLAALEEHADAARGLPLHTHRGGAGRVVLAAKWMFRKTCQVFINEAFARQRLFNGHVRDAYAQLSAEVLQLRKQVETLRTEGTRAPEPQASPRPRKPSRRPTASPKKRSPEPGGAERKPRKR